MPQHLQNTVARWERIANESSSDNMSYHQPTVIAMLRELKAAATADGAELSAELSPTERALKDVYDILYWDADTCSYDPDKSWDHCIVELIADIVRDVLPDPDPGTTDYPPMKD